MWSILNVGEVNDYYLLFEEINGFHVFITNFITLWFKSWSKSEFLSCLKESNPCLEIDDCNLVQKGISILRNVKDINKVERLNGADDNLTLVVSQSFGYPIRINLKLQNSSREMFFKKITQPLLNILNDVTKSQTELCELLTKKDKEIREYKEEGGSIALRHLKTAKFNQDEHLNKYRSFKTHFSFDVFPSSTLGKNVDVLSLNFKTEPGQEDTHTDIVKVKDETQLENIIETKPEIKLEPLSQSQNSQNSSNDTSPRKKRKKLPV